MDPRSYEKIDEYFPSFEYKYSGFRDVYTIRMKRNCDLEKLKGHLINLRTECPNVTLGTSVIVGFPGETEEDFEETINFCYDVHFSFIWQHYFSVREGTEAEKMSNKVPLSVQKERAKKLGEYILKHNRADTVTVPSDNVDDYRMGSKAQG